MPSEPDEIISKCGVLVPDVIENDIEIHPSTVVEKHENSTIIVDFDVLSAVQSSITDSIFECETFHKLTVNAGNLTKTSGSQGNIGSNNIANVAVENSEDISFGNKTYFTGPVVIKQFVVDNETMESNQKEDEFKTMKKTTSISNSCMKAYCMKHRSKFIFVIITCVVLAIVGSVLGYLQIKGYEYSDYSTTSPYTIDGDDVDYEFVSRIEYGAMETTETHGVLGIPVQRVIFAHTVTANCSTFATCAAQARQVQSYHINVNKWVDIGLNFMVGGDGRAYEGCGYTLGAHTLGFNNYSVCISFIGDFSTIEAPGKQLWAAQRLIDEGIELGKIRPDYVLFCQTQLRPNITNLSALCNQIVSWPHWSNEVIIPTV